MAGNPWEPYIKSKNLPLPSQKTVDRWVVKWKPIIMEIERQYKIRQDKLRKDKKRQDEEKDRQDEDKIGQDKNTPTHGELIDAYVLLHEIKKNFKAEYEAHKVKYAAEFKRYGLYNYKNYAAFTEVVNDHFENLKITMELIK